MGYLAGVVNSDLDGLILPLNGYYMGVDNFSDATTYDLLGDTYKLISIDPMVQMILCASTMLQKNIKPWLIKCVSGMKKVMFTKTPPIQMIRRSSH